MVDDDWRIEQAHDHQTRQFLTAYYCALLGVTSSKCICKSGPAIFESYVANILNLISHRSQNIIEYMVFLPGSDDLMDRYTLSLRDIILKGLFVLG